MPMARERMRETRHYREFADERDSDSETVAGTEVDVALHARYSRYRRGVTASETDLRYSRGREDDAER